MNETLREAHWPTLVFEDGEAGDLCRCSCGKQGFDYKQGREWFAEHLAALASEAAPVSGEGLREGDDDGSTLNERLSDVATGTVTGMTDRRIERIVRDADYALRALERGDIDNARAALRRGFQRAPVGLRASTATPPEPGLDVERLALAECPEGERDGSGPCSHHLALAVGHVAAYLRLSASPIPEAD